MTNKLLTLEEIEEIEKGVGKHYMTVKADVAFDLLTTARAYHELSAKYEQGLEKAHLEGHAMARANPEDKPHAPTIKAFIDGLKWANDPKKRFTVNELVNYLESILKDLNN